MPPNNETPRFNHLPFSDALNEGFRFFGNLSTAEIADALSVRVDAALRDWRMARAWLDRELDRGEGRA